MTRLTALTLALIAATACRAPAKPPPHTLIPTVPSCSQTPPAVPVPSPPRTWDTILAYANATEHRRAETAQALDTCRASLSTLQHWLDHHPLPTPEMVSTQ